MFLRNSDGILMGKLNTSFWAKIVKFHENFEKIKLLSQQQIFFKVGKGLVWTYHNVWMDKIIHLKDFEGFQQMLTT